MPERACWHEPIPSQTSVVAHSPPSYSLRRAAWKRRCALPDTPGDVPQMNCGGQALISEARGEGARRGAHSLTMRLCH